MIAQVESYREALGELMPLYRMLWDEAGPPGIPLDPRWDVYDALDRNGQVVVVALRDEGEMVGHSLAFITPALHSARCTSAETDTIFVHPKARGRFGGLRLLREMRRELKRRGVERWQASVPLRVSARGLGQLYRLVGMCPEQISYGVRL
jgi:GNAT superfamily N-acetyltransferase